MKDVTPERLIKGGIRNYLKDVHTALPGIIDEFDPSTQLAKIQPAIKRMLKTEDGEKEIIVPRSLPLCINVPVILPSGGGFHLTFPINRGDECLLIFCERSMDLWLDQGGVQQPSAKRFFSLSDGFAIMGLHSKPKAISGYNNTAIELRTTGNKITIENGLTTMTGDVRIVGNLVTTGNNSTVGNQTVNGSSLINGAANFNSSVRNGGINIGGGHQHAGDSGGTTSSPI